MELNCFKCSELLVVIEPISRKEECPKCMSDVRCCRNCIFYDAKVYNECREPQAERILEKERSNLCDFFKPGRKSALVQEDKEKQKAAAEALFKSFKKS